MANQDAAFGLRPLKTVGQQDDSTGMSSYNISPGDASVIFQGALVGSPATGTGYIDLQTAGLVLNLGAFWGTFYNDPTTLKPTFKNSTQDQSLHLTVARLRHLCMTVHHKCTKSNQTMQVLLLKQTSSNVRI